MDDKSPPREEVLKSLRMINDKGNGGRGRDRTYDQSIKSRMLWSTIVNIHASFRKYVCQKYAQTYVAAPACPGHIASEGGCLASAFSIALLLP
jgi:hypothetical protein